MISDKYFTVAQAAKFCGISRQTVWRWVREGSLSSEKFSGLILIQKENLSLKVCPTCGAKTYSRK